MLVRILQTHDHVFGPDEIAILTTAYDGVLRTLALTNHDDPATIIVAQCIIELAKRGERDPVRLQIETLKALRRDSTGL